ncbi:RNA polymerase sigma factor [Nonomuraea typhae]|uniref:RNA polymerase sigma factor n=1 Tax=Nonomuraea typhae TaxID=2603600 RepID=UPI0012F83974|nr:sigma-70 family RNA polymerase sigma factor [Nonomuraea typhae]
MHSADPIREALAAWYIGNLGGLVLFAMMLGASRHEADDLVHSAFVEALPCWADISHPGAYLRTCISRAYRHGRSRLREEPVAQLPNLAAEPDSAWDAVEFDDQQRRVLNVIRQLPARQRQVLAWTLDGYDPHEIAERLGMRPGAVRANLFKARRNLATAVATWGGSHA